MARRSKGYSGSQDDDTREDGDDTADTHSERDYSAQAEGYEVMEAGTIINGVYYPKEDAPAGEEMTVHLSEENAQALVDGGVKLSKDGEECVPTPKEDPPAQVEDPAA